jgi:hypothetical protein
MFVLLISVFFVEYFLACIGEASMAAACADKIRCIFQGGIRFTYI